MRREEQQETEGTYLQEDMYHECVRIYRFDVADCCLCLVVAMLSVTEEQRELLFIGDKFDISDTLKKLLPPLCCCFSAFSNLEAARTSFLGESN